MKQRFFDPFNKIQNDKNRSVCLSKRKRSLIKKITLITVCLILLTSCGRKNEPKYEASLNNNVMKFNNFNNVFKMPKKDEIYQ